MRLSRSHGLKSTEFILSVCGGDGADPPPLGVQQEFTGGASVPPAVNDKVKSRNRIRPGRVDSQRVLDFDEGARPGGAGNQPPT